MSVPTTEAGRALLSELVGDGWTEDLTVPMVLAIEQEARRTALDEAIAAVWGLLPMRDDPEAHVDYALRVVIDALTRLREQGR